MRTIDCYCRANRNHDAIIDQIICLCWRIKWCHLLKNWNYNVCLMRKPGNPRKLCRSGLHQFGYRMVLTHNCASKLKTHFWRASHWQVRQATKIAQVRLAPIRIAHDIEHWLWKPTISQSTKTGQNMHKNGRSQLYTSLFHSVYLIIHGTSFK